MLAGISHPSAGEPCREIYLIFHTSDPTARANWSGCMSGCRS